MTQNSHFPWQFVRFHTVQIRGTAIATRAFAMKTTANMTVNAEPSATTPDDWVEAHGDYLFNFAIGQARDASVAEDLVQETFLAAFKSRDRFTGKSSQRTWLVGILRHKIYDHLRHTCRERAVRADTAPVRRDDEAWDDTVLCLHDVAAECQSPSRRLELEELRANLELALGKLPSRVAQVFQLYEVEFLDLTGVALLSSFRARGVVFVDCSPFVEAQLKASASDL